MSNLVNNRGVPLATQRSDDWVLEETPEKVPTPPDMSPDAARRYIATRLRSELELADLERQIREAEATLAKLKPAYEKARADLERNRAADAARPPSR